MADLTSFWGQKNGYSVSKTLRNRLIPDFYTDEKKSIKCKTEEKIKELGLLYGDFERPGAYIDVKNLIDDFHRSYLVRI